MSRTSSEELALNCIEQPVEIEQTKQLKEHGIDEDHLNMVDRIRLNRTQEIGVYAMKGEIACSNGGKEERTRTAIPAFLGFLKTSGKCVKLL